MDAEKAARQLANEAANVRASQEGFDGERSPRNSTLPMPPREPSSRAN